MVKIVASRVAGFKLAWILTVLLLPIIFLGWVITNQLSEERTTVAAQVRGTEFLNLVVPVMLDAASGKIDPESKARLLDHGPALAHELGLILDFNSLMVSLSVPNVSNDAVLAETSALTIAAGAQSKIISSPHYETLQLANAGAVDLPEVIVKFKALQRIAASASASTNADSNQSVAEAVAIAKVLLAMGELKSTNDRLSNAINAARGASADGFDYSEIKSATDRIQRDVSGLSVGALNNFGQSNALASSVSVQVSSFANSWMSDYRHVWKMLDLRASQLMTKRQQELTHKIWLVVGLAIVAALIGIGSAIQMFGSTLRKLDAVETARRDADDARYAAEDMSSKLHTINNDMVKVNTELANNMQMLRDAQDALLKKGRMEQLGQLTATIAHELRNPLGAVRTSAFLIERKLKGKEIGVEPQLLRINNGITRCDQIITQLLDFSRSKTITCSMEDMDKWLEGVIAEEAARLPASVTIDCMLGLKGKAVPFDPSRMQRAIINLVSNASEAMVGNGENPGRYAVTNPNILVSTRVVGTSAVISVIDNGPGISPENLLKIREPLFTTKSFGTGLGLPAVEQIINQHGGSLEVQSTMGRGASFIVRLPLTQAEAETEAAA